MRSAAERPDSRTSTCVMLLVKARRVWLNMATNPRMMTASNDTVTIISMSEKAGEATGAECEARSGEATRESLDLECADMSALWGWETCLPAGKRRRVAALQIAAPPARNSELPPDFKLSPCVFM